MTSRGSGKRSLERLLLSWSFRLRGVPAPLRDDAVPAFRHTGLADVTPVQDQQVVRVEQQIGGDAGDQPVFHGARCGSMGESGAIGDAKDVGIDREGWLAERHIQHDVGGFAADARQCLQPRAVARHLSAVSLDQKPR